MSQNMFSVFNEPEVIEESVPAPVPAPTSNFDNVSLDSTGMSWADMEDDDFVPTQTPKKVKDDFVPSGFTKVQKKRKSKPVETRGKMIRCIQCGNNFEFSNEKALFFESKGWAEPKRCKQCNSLKKSLGALPKRSQGPKKKINVQ